MVPSGSVTGNMGAVVSVLFMHGLESGPGGSKHRALIDAFGQDQVACPDMQMSKFRLDKSNSFLRSLALSLVLNPLSPMRSAFRRSLDGCLDAHRHYLSQMGSESVVVGSSWGGAVALRALADGEVKGGCLLIAPAYGLCARTFHGEAAAEAFVKESLFDRLNAALSDEQRARCLVVHGTDDETVPFADSQALTDATGMTLVTIPGGDHRLNDALLAGGGGGKLKGLVDKLRGGGD